jgi:hypothetical protein
MSKNTITLYQSSYSDLQSFTKDQFRATIPVTNPAAAKTSSKQSDEKTTTDDKAKDLVTRALASLAQPNSANQIYGAGDTLGSVGVAYRTFGQVNASDGHGQVAGETTFLEARARTYQTKIGYGAEAQAGLFRSGYGVKFDASLAKKGDHELFGVGVQGTEEEFVGAQVNAQAGAGTKKGLPSAEAGVSAFAGARVVVTAGGEVRVLGLGLRAGGQADAWAGAQGSASVSASAAGVSAEVEGFAGAEASASGTASFAGIGITAEGDAYAGAGGKAGISIGYNNGTISVEAELGAALGVGAGGEIGVGVNLDQLVGDGEAFLGTMESLFDSGAQAATQAASDAGQTAGNIVQDAEHAAGQTGQALVNGAEQAVDAVASFFGF